MKCPNCGNNLERSDYKGIKIDECVSCKGRWFDRGELKKAKDRTDNDLRWLDFDLFDDNTSKYNISLSEKQCPQDSSNMTSLTYMDSKVIIEKCNTCQGVWLDNHEFEKIIKYLGNIVITETASQYAKEVVKEFESIFTGSENKIAEIKDFLAVVKLFELKLAVEHPWVIKVSEAMNTYWPIR